MKLSNSIASALFVLSCQACSTPSQDQAQRSEKLATPAKVAPWTTKFLEEAVLSAAQVRIEGPPGLLDHYVIMQDPDNHEYVTRTTPEGLLTEATVKPNGPGNAIRAQLDKLVIAADHSIVVLERPSAVPVSVDASGDAVYVIVQTGAEQRAPKLRIVGEPGK